MKLIKTTDGVDNLICSSASITYSKVLGGWITEAGDFFSDPFNSMHTDVQIAALIGPMEFQMLFTPDELVACEDAKANKAKVKVLWKILDDPRTESVDRNSSFMKEAITYLETSGVIGAGRADEILNS